jgi:FkbM family methyltransferase
MATKSPDGHQKPMRSPLKWIGKTVRQSPALSRAALYALPDWPVNIRIEPIGELRIHIRRNRSLWLRPPLTHEWYPLAVLRNFVGPEDTVWDAGANIGLYSRWIAGHLKARRVVAFEPMAANVPELIHNIGIGGIASKVKVVQWALSDFNGPMEFQVDDVQSASGSLDSVRRGAASVAREALRLPPKTETVLSRTIDDLLMKQELPVPDVMKIDVEGAEFLLLRGGEDFFTRHSPKILIETHGTEVARQCVEFLLDHGYAVAGCVPETWNADRHMRLGRGTLPRIQDQYDVHFIAAAKDGALIPERLDYSKL